MAGFVVFCLSTLVLCLVPGLICTLVIWGFLFSCPQPVYGVSSQWIWKPPATSISNVHAKWRGTGCAHLPSEPLWCLPPAKNNIILQVRVKEKHRRASFPHKRTAPKQTWTVLCGCHCSCLLIPTAAGSCEQEGVCSLEVSIADSTMGGMLTARLCLSACLPLPFVGWSGSWQEATWCRGRYHVLVLPCN